MPIYSHVGSVDELEHEILDRARTYLKIFRFAPTRINRCSIWLSDRSKALRFGSKPKGGSLYETVVFAIRVGIEPQGFRVHVPDPVAIAVDINLEHERATTF